MVAVGQATLVHRDNVVSRVRFRARLYGRNETVRAVRAVLAVLAATAPAGAFRTLTARLPAELVPPAAWPGSAASSRQFVSGVAACLYLDEPSAAFLTRVVFEELNAYCPTTGPAGFAALVPADLRPLLTARADPDVRQREMLSSSGLAAPALRLTPDRVAPDRDVPDPVAPDRTAPDGVAAEVRAAAAAGVEDTERALRSQQPETRAPRRAKGAGAKGASRPAATRDRARGTQ
jgi:uncharacterized protein (DUF2267 family)